ncbi:AsmA family protein [Flavihumibacter petaseus]|uniref:AsmA domain-containing protein n=1 Tax=Flavihumibacter petaseus NBRC 106054 TaxID=1220578 RepID=A0A0E9N070_9BACT|nr:AsmA-like C-terminal region-containing protein [Flavihumibacter petaseus]GAO43178.1 hypothetical protein FPE01S_02_02820 [Flavihumibacter petaseus NBRC 106054]
MKKTVVKVLKITGIVAASVLGLLFLLPILFPVTIAARIKEWTNQSIKGELNFSKARLSFFQHFPTLTLTLHDYSLLGAEPFAKDTLMAGHDLSFGINLASLLHGGLVVDQFFVDDSRIHIRIDEKGNANYNIYRSSEKAAPATTDTTSNTSLKIERIQLSDCQLIYDDRSLPMRIEAVGFDYEGKGDLAKNEFDLRSKFHADALDFTYNGTHYLNRRKLEADLITSINTSSLRFRFQQNKLLINQLPVDFSGTMAILKDGYDIDLHVVSGTTDFGNVFSILPPDYEQWFRDTQFNGTSRLTVDLTGAYRAATNEAPDLAIGLWVRNGSINHNKAPVPLKDVAIRADLMLPGLNADSLALTADSINFTLNGLPTSTSLQWKGLTTPQVKANINSQLDLGLLHRALGMTIAALNGKLDLRATADGTYRTGQNPKNFRPDTVVLAIPNYTLQATVSNGYFKYKDLPLALENVHAEINSTVNTGRWEDISANISNLQAAIGKGHLQGRLSVTGLDKSELNADLKADLPLESITQAIPLQGYAFGGELHADIKANGHLDAGRRLFPAAQGKLQWTNGLVQTPYYPHPVRDIQVNGQLNSNKGSYDDLMVVLEPVSFTFEEQPFALTARLSDFNDLRYALTATGALDLGRIYQVFAIKGYSVSGLVRTNLSLGGTQADAVAGRYQRLKNSGTLQMENLSLRSDDYPYPFLVPEGTLEFRQDKAWLKNTVLQYQENKFKLNGYAQNLVAYWLQDELLTGKMEIASERVVVNDFMVFADTATSANTGASSPGGVVLLPKNLNLSLQATIKEIIYGASKLNDFAGSVTLQNGQLVLNDARAGIAGAVVSVAGNYAPVDLHKAGFGVTLKADSFDVKRAYREVPLFREMASSAANAEGVVSVDYAINGRLNDKMEPVYPSLAGKGEVKLEDVKVNGLKLFGAVGKASGKDSINNPNLKAVVIRSSVKNNIITIERTKMKVFGFRLRAEGQTSLDGKLNMRFRLGLPPLGIIGIPMTITGNAENPVVKVRKGREEDELEEEEDTEDVHE